MDDSMSQEVTNHMFQEPGKQWGTDLAALNIQASPATTGRDGHKGRRGYQTL